MPAQPPSLEVGGLQPGLTSRSLSIWRKQASYLVRGHASSDALPKLPTLLRPTMRLQPISRLQPSKNYVLDLAHSATASRVAAALSNDAVHIISAAATGSLEKLDAFPNQQNFVTQLSFASAEQPHLLFVSSKDGHLRSFDIQSGQQVEGYACSRA